MFKLPLRLPIFSSASNYSSALLPFPSPRLNISDTLLACDVQLPCGTLVSLAGDLASVQGVDGELVSAERLGPGVVERTVENRNVLVHWAGADIESWVDCVDLRPLSSDAHLVSISKLDRRGACKQMCHKVGLRLGLHYNWTVELRPGNVLRTVRGDGSSWTFRNNPLLGRVDVFWPQPPTDDDAEALLVAELAVG